MDKLVRFRKILKELYEKIITDELNISLATLVMLIIVIVIPSLLAGEYAKPGFLDNIVASANSMVFDLFIIGIFITGLSKIGEKKRQIQQYLNEIDDFRNWPEQIAAHRIRGNIIRLNKLGIKKINLNNCYLAHAKLEGINLINSDMWKANLEGCDLENSKLQNADLWNSNITGAILRNANLSHANLDSAILTNADFSDSNLDGTRLINTILLNTDFTNSILDNADLTGAKNLDPIKLSKVKSAVNVKVDEKLLNQLKKYNPGLFDNV
jgi:hypothetical protein